MHLELGVIAKSKGTASDESGQHLVDHAACPPADSPGHAEVIQLQDLETDIVAWLVGWLDLFSAELSPKRYWRGPRSQEVGEEGDCTKLTLPPAE